jgi:hypothetical protein
VEKVYIYQADIYCEGCGREMIAALEKTTGKPPLELREDSDAWPQGPYPDGGGEADCAQHCGGCGGFLENPLTGDGYENVAESIGTRAYYGDGSIDVLKQWAEFYKGENTMLDNAIQEWQALKPEEWK